MPISLNALGVNYTQDFDTLSNATGTINNALTIPGWYLTESLGGARDNEQYAVNNGGSNTGDTYSYGADGSTERSLGTLRSGSLDPVFGAFFTNDTGSMITSLNISYTGEEWRLGSAGRTDHLNFEYQVGASEGDLLTGAWTSVAALNFLTPDIANTGAKDGNSVFSTLSGTITGLSIAPGATFGIRWTDSDASSSDDGLAVDNFALSASGSTPANNVIGGITILAEADSLHGAVGAAPTASNALNLVRIGAYDSNNDPAVAQSGGAESVSFDPQTVDFRRDLTRDFR